MEGRSTPASINARDDATAAVQEDVDVVGLSILSGAHMTLFPGSGSFLSIRDARHPARDGGGIIPARIADSLQALGIGRLFGPAPRRPIGGLHPSWATTHLS